MKAFKSLILFIALVIPGAITHAQHPEEYTRPAFTRQDSLRGSVTPERAWWKLTYYHLDVEVFPSDSSLNGSVLIQYQVLDSPRKMQIDMQPPMRITGITQDGQELDFTRDGNAWFVDMASEQQPGTMRELKVFYSGKPRVSRRPPWDPAITWAYDENGNPFIATACQGDGASMWWPCKDHMYEEPDSMLITITTPGNLMAVSNGRFRGMKKNRGGTRTWSWFVSAPISNYVVNLNVGDYAHFSEVYPGEAGALDCDYYVLRDNLEKAKEQFKQVAGMLEAFEHWFGPYPFYEDGYKLVEVPYPGMEHQSSVTYGNGFQNGFGGYDLSRTGWGDRFDYIIIHESGHEWFANSITYRDIADMWVHEGFTTYSEGLYVEYHYGKDAGYEYLRGLRSSIQNDRPIIGEYDVNHVGSGDMYPKAANMLHTIRQLVDDDDKWRGILRGINRTFRHQVVTTQQIEAYMNEHTDIDLSKIFDQYLRDDRVPTFEYRFGENTLAYRWTNCISGFDMPVKIQLGGKEILLHPTTRWTLDTNIPEIVKSGKTVKGDAAGQNKTDRNDFKGIELVVNRDFYVAVLNSMGE